MEVDPGRVFHEDPVESLKKLVFLRGGLKTFHDPDPDVVECIIDLLDHMEAVDAYLGAREVNFCDILVQLEHVRAYIFDLVTLFLADP
jgi:hypothetical protein